MTDYQGSQFVQQPPVETIVGDGAGWVAGVRKDQLDTSVATDDVTSPYETPASYDDMRSELGCLRAEVERMSEMEGECVRKDDLIVQLRDEVTNLQNFVRHIEVDRCPMCQQNSAANPSAVVPLSSAPAQRTAETGCEDATNFMRAVVEGVQQTATIELVCQMQRDMTIKDETIARLARELDAAKKVHSFICCLCLVSVHVLALKVFL